MKIDFGKWLKDGEKIGLRPFQIQYSTAEETTVFVQDGAIDSQTVGISQDISGKALYKGCVGSFGTDRIDKDTEKLFLESIRDAALYGRKERKTCFFDKIVPYPHVRTAS